MLEPPQAKIPQADGYLAALHETALGIMSRLDILDLLQEIVDRALGLVPASHATLWLVRPEIGQIELVIGTGVMSRLVGARVPPGSGAVGTVVRTGRPLILDDYDRWEGRTDLIGDIPLGPVIAFPLKSGNEVTGVLGLSRTPGQPSFSPGEINSMAHFADLASIALDNARLHTSLQEAKTMLDRRVEERTRELVALLDVAHNIVATLDLDAVLSRVVGNLRHVIECAGAAIYILEGETLRMVESHGMQLPAAVRRSVPFEQAPVHWQVLESRQPVILDDIHGADPMAEQFRVWAGDLTGTLLAPMHSWMGVPMFVRERPVGVLSVIHGSPGVYTPAHARLASAFAGQAAVAIDNARLYQETRQRADELQTLFAVQQAIASQHDMPVVLQRIADEARRLTGSDFGVVAMRDGDSLEITVVSGTLEPGLVGRRVPLVGSVSGVAVTSRQPVIFEDSAADPRIHPAFRNTGIGGGVMVPLLSRGEAIGIIVVGDRQARRPGPDEVRILTLLGSSAAIGIENARLVEQAQELAKAAERSRLARDLHDAVTQTLFSTSLLAEVLPRLWEQDPELGRQRLQDLRQLTRGALAEMRTLLVELRPAALTEASLPDLLRQLAEAAMGRARLPVTLTVEGAGSLPQDVQVALYRIAQEALNNVGKHADAQQATVHLRLQTPAGSAPCNRVDLEVADDGRGFDVRSVGPQHLGLGIMRERAASIGATFEVESRPGKGTRLAVRWPDERKD